MITAAMTDNRLPKGFPGGWAYTKPFVPVPFEKGQVWRKCGPINAIRIIRVLLPGYEEYDGGAQGISVEFTRMTEDGKVRWSGSFFMTGSADSLHEYLKESGYALCAD